METIDRDLINKKKLSNVTIVFTYFSLVFWAIIIMIPSYWMIVTALKPESVIMKVPPELFPKRPTFENFTNLFKIAPFLRWFLNSTLVAVISTCSAILLDSMAGFSFAIIKPKGHKIVFVIILGCLMIPDQIKIVPLFMLINKLNWYNTYQALIVPFMASAFGMFLMKQYMSSIPKELVEVAKIAGCNYFMIYWKILLPLSKPVLAVLGITLFVGFWNSLLWPLILTSTTEMRTLTVGISSLSKESMTMTRYGLTMAGATITALPIIIIFLKLQKYFTKGIVLGAVKE